jgi:bla regulator protein BlaR1
MDATIMLIDSWARSIEGWWWPMLWQSSLLIAFVRVVEILLRRRVCAAIRYALWLLVLVKLLLPPSLAFPSGAAWWLRARSIPVTSQPPVATLLTIRYGELFDRSPGLQPVALAQPALRLSGQSMIVLGVIAVSVALFSWSFWRWRAFARQTARRGPLSEEMRSLLAGTVSPGTLDRLQIAITPRLVAPAVYGLVRPVIVIPRALIDRLSQAEMRAVLLHEIIHYRRGDLWVNLAQTVLQIVFWWHPPLWMANARIRNLREEAVDDAVMACLRSEAEVYAPTLLQVADLMVRRPSMVLGLVGILESRSPLRRRIERLINYVPPRQKGAGILWISIIVAFGALALPMGPRVERVGEPNAAGVVQPALETSADQQSPRAAALAARGTEAHSEEDLSSTSASDDTLHTRLFRINPAIFESEATQMLDPSTNRCAAAYEELRNWVTSIGLDFTPPKTLYYHLDGRLMVRATRDDLDRLQKEIEARQAKGRTAARTNTLGLDAKRPTSIVSTEGPKLFTRVFRVDPVIFESNLCGMFPVISQAEFTSETLESFRRSLSSLGVVIEPPKTLSYKPGGRLIVRATMNDIDALERVLKDLSRSLPRVEIQVTIIEAPARDVHDFWTSLDQINSTRVLAFPDDSKARQYLAAATAIPGAIAREGHFSTLSGRQTQITFDGATNLLTTIASNSVPVLLTNPVQFGFSLEIDAAIRPEGTNVHLRASASKMDLLGYDDPGQFVPQTPIAEPGLVTTAVLPLPHFRIRRIEPVETNLVDGQTLVFGHPIEFDRLVPVSGGQIPAIGHLFRSSAQDKNMIVFLTPTIVEPLGHRANPLSKPKNKDTAR